MDRDRQRKGLANSRTRVPEAWVVIRVLIRILERMFVVGSVGSALVVLLTTIEDIKEFLFAKGEDPQHRPADDEHQDPPAN